MWNIFKMQLSSISASVVTTGSGTSETAAAACDAADSVDELASGSLWSFIDIHKDF